MLAFYMTYIEDDQDKDKFVVIYKTYVDSMVKIADNILKDYGQAEDAVHEAFLYILSKLKSIDDPLSSQTKVLVEKCVIHKSMDMCRSRQAKLKKVRPITDEDADLLPDKRDIAAELEDADQYSRVKQYLLELSEDDRELLELYYFSKVPAKEIADLLGITKKTVYNRLHNIMQYLQRRLFTGGGFA